MALHHPLLLAHGHFWGLHPERGSGYYVLERFYNTPKPVSQLAVTRIFPPLILAPELSSPLLLTVWGWRVEGCSGAEE